MPLKNEEFVPKQIDDSIYTVYRNEITNNVVLMIDENKSQDDGTILFDSLNDYEKLAYSLHLFEVSISRINRLERFSKVDNNYCAPIEYLNEFIVNSDYAYKDKFSELYDDYQYIYFYGEKRELHEFLRKKDNVMRKYDEICFSLTDYFENYFIENMPSEFKKQLLEKYHAVYKI